MVSATWLSVPVWPRNCTLTDWIPPKSGASNENSQPMRLVAFCHRTYVQVLAAEQAIGHSETPVLAAAFLDLARIKSQHSLLASFGKTIWRT